MAVTSEAALWQMVHEARRELVTDLQDLDSEQWASESLCGGWSVQEVVAHLTAAASLGRWRWMRSILGSGFRPSVHNQRRLAEHLGPTPAQTLARFAAVVDSTVAPSADTPAYLGEVLVHGQDIRQPLGIATVPPPRAWLPVAEFFARRNFTVASKSTIKGLQLRATDARFETGAGAEVAGPLSALVMAMAGRPVALEQLTGPGVQVLADRITPRR